MKIYTDGSFNKKLSKNTTAYAAVIITEETNQDYIVDIVYGILTDFAYVNMWNVGGEIWAVLAGIDYAISQYNPKDISLYYDYIGIGKWANKEWKTNNPTTSSYARYMKNTMSERSVTFNKVAGHSNNQLNDLADEYANLGTKVYLETGKISNLVSGLRISKK